MKPLPKVKIRYIITFGGINSSEDLCETPDEGTTILGCTVDVLELPVDHVGPIAHRFETKDTVMLKVYELQRSNKYYFSDSAE